MPTRFTKITDNDMALLRKKYDLKDNRISTELIKDVVESRGGKIEEGWKYHQWGDKVPILCGEGGHKWSTTWSILKDGCWCPKCAGRLVYEEDVRRLIEDKEGKVDPDWKFVDSYEKFWVTCKLFHRWLASYRHLKDGSWCPECAGQVVHEEDVRKLIESKGGKLDPDWHYNGEYEKFWIQCSCGRRWQTNWVNINQGSWCHYCTGYKVDVNFVRKFIADKGGKLDDDWQFISCDTKFWIQCDHNHRWQAIWGNISRGTWCPYCKNFKREEDFRKFIEEYLGMPFPTAKPFWLINPDTHRRLQLDGLNEENKIAFELQGQQHYELCYMNGYSESVLKRIQKRDATKKDVCEKLGIRLIIVPYGVLKKNWKSLVDGYLSGIL